VGTSENDPFKFEQFFSDKMWIWRYLEW
jgi:hypothetical protein